MLDYAKVTVYFVVCFMKKVKHLLFVILFTLSKCAFSQVNQYHDDGTRHGPWKKNFKNTEQVRYTGNFDHGVEIGEFKYYTKGFPNQPSAIKKFSDNGKVADIAYYSQRGKKISQGKLIDRNREGTWEYYHNRSGNIMMIENYKNDVLEGTRTSYYENKQISETTEFINGKKEGKQLVYSLKGVLIKEFTYKNNILQGSNKFFNGKGELTIDGNYHKNKKTGLWKYYEGGTLVRQKQF